MITFSQKLRTREATYIPVQLYRISSPVVVWSDEVHHVEEHGWAGDDPLGAGDQGVLHPQLVLHGGLLDVRGHCDFTFDKCLFFLSISLYTLSEITEENRINIVLKLISSTIIFQELSALFVSQLEAYLIQIPGLNMIHLT